MSKRKQRVDQFVTVRPGVKVSLSGDLVECARALLQMALDQRRGEVLRYREDHFSWYAIGSILLLVSALEAWLNEVLSEALFISDRQRLIGLADEPLLAKYYEIPNRVTGVRISPNEELTLLVDVRHEIAHYMPRILPDEGGVPNWLVDLHRRHLFLGGRDEGRAILSWRFASYRLAYWAWETAEAAVAEFVTAASVEVEGVALGCHCAGNFSCFRTICPPSELAEYDAQHGLELTRIVKPLRPEITWS
ncbi:MAG: hypothetical protein ABSG55_02260 [Dehalococcoidia bacterium]